MDPRHLRLGVRRQPHGGQPGVGDAVGHPVGDEVGRDAPQGVLAGGAGGAEEARGGGLRGEDGRGRRRGRRRRRCLLGGRGRRGLVDDDGGGDGPGAAGPGELDVGAGADPRREDLLEALAAGHLLYGLEVLWIRRCLSVICKAGHFLGRGGGLGMTLPPVRSHLDGLDLQLERGVLVADDHGVGVQLQAREGPHVVDAALDAPLQGEGLAGAEDDGDDLAGLEDGLDADGEGHLGDAGEVVAEEARVGEDGVVGEGLDAGARGEAGAGLVEGDVAVLADAGEEEVDAAGAPDLGLVLDALGLEVGGVAVEDVDAGRADVDVLEEVLPHEGVVALRVVPGDADVLVHVEGDDVLE